MIESNVTITYRGHLWAKSRANVGDSWQYICEIIDHAYADEKKAATEALILGEQIQLASEKTYKIDICVEKIEDGTISIIDTLTSDQIINTSDRCPECNAEL